jgi:hypothetical protein
MITLGVGLIRINTGQVQRINSVLFSIQVYWASLFLLPGQVIKNVEQIMRSFMWSSSDMRTTGAKMAWDQVCLPKEEWGGDMNQKDSIIEQDCFVEKHLESVQ